VKITTTAATGAIVFVFGLIIGSFLNVVIYRVPKNLSISFPPSFCPACKKPIKWYDNIPVFSYIAIGGRCSHCNHKISIRYPIVELIMGLLFFLFFLKFRLEKIYFFYIIMVGYMVALAFIDIDKKIVPGRIVVFLFATGMVFGVFGLNNSVSFFDGIIGAAAGGFIIYAMSFLSNGKIGEGDVQLFMALGMCLGLKNVLELIFYSFLLGGAVAAVFLLTGKYKRKDAVAFVPFISAAFIIKALLQ
jgi:leader peptidase (prepilin peptidase)/N-methyltransferase